MKLERYQDKSKMKRKVILISISVVVLISVSLLLYKTFASFTESAEFPMMNGKVDYFGNSDVYFAFYNGDDQLEEMPQKNNAENLVFEHAECDNGASIVWNYEQWSPLVKNLSKSKTKCRLFFQKMYDDNNLYDLSTHNYDGIFMNGAIVKDDNGKKGIYFDGGEAFVDIADLPATIDWNGGFTIEFEAKWLSFNRWTRIFDFGNGVEQDNIFAANAGSTNNLNFDSRYIDTSRGSSTAENAIDLNEIVNFKIEIIKNEGSYTNNIYKNNELILTKIYEVEDFLRNINRTENYLGKSNWSLDSYFNGYIYSFKILDKNKDLVLWYNVDF